eukprot:1161912-Pelagomonas_calceolata.AAC.3
MVKIERGAWLQKLASCTEQVISPQDLQDLMQKMHFLMLVYSYPRGGYLRPEIAYIVFLHMLPAYVPRDWQLLNFIWVHLVDSNAFLYSTIGFQTCQLGGTKLPRREPYF